MCSEQLDEIAKYLNTYNGRDKFIRTLCYASRLASGLIKSEKSAKVLRDLSSHLSQCRETLRLFDDIPMLSYTLSYGLGKEDEDNLVRSVNVASNFVDQIYYPIEHLSWAADHKLLSIDGEPWSTASTVCWAITLYLGLIKIIRILNIIQRHKTNLRGVDCDTSLAVASLRLQQRKNLLAGIRCILDLVHAVHCLPKGYLWSGRLSTWQVGLIGTLSSLLGLYMSFPRKSKAE